MFLVKPHFAKPNPPPQQPQDEDSDDDDRGTAETQLNAPSNDKVSDEEDISEYASDASHKPKKRKVHKNKADMSSTQQSKDGKQGKDGPVTTAARKIKATAHANYCRLKIKSKGGNGGKGRFGRRR